MAARLWDGNDIPSLSEDCQPIITDCELYVDALRVLWNHSVRVFVNVEHDMAYSAALVDDLAACPHPYCTFAYMRRDKREFAQSRTSDGSMRDPIQVGDEWAGWSGIGFCKAVGPRVQIVHGGHWEIAEALVNGAVPQRANGMRWHVHWPAIGHGPDARRT